jgi:hypothetical protein
MPAHANSLSLPATKCMFSSIVIGNIHGGEMGSYVGKGCEWRTSGTSAKSDVPQSGAGP